MKDRIIVHKEYRISNIDSRLFGSFIEHLGRAVYGGIFEPGHDTADKNGFRQDVIEMVKDLNLPLVRYPGGNYVSSYNWEDSVGPIEDRPQRLDLAWKSLETNEVGLHEFFRWTEMTGTELMMAINLGTRGIAEAQNLVEYCNHIGGSYWSDLRRKHGREKPFGIKLWCLGNEMDGPWQVGQKTAYEYGKLANETAKALKMFDEDMEFCVCGSSMKELPTFPDWEREVLEECYENVDYLSLHMYANNSNDDLPTYLATSVGMDEFIETVIGVCDFVKAKKRSDKTMYLSFDEWNVWYHSLSKDKETMAREPWKVGPGLLEDHYNLEDALVVGMMMNSLLRHSQRVRIACLAQLVNVIAPIMTEPGGPVWKQTIFYPFYYASLYGRGMVLNLSISSGHYQNSQYGQVPYIDAAAVYNEEDGYISCFIVSRDIESQRELDVVLEHFNPRGIDQQFIMHHSDTKAGNSAEHPEKVIPTTLEVFSLQNNVLHGVLPALCWCFILLKL